MAKDAALGRRMDTRYPAPRSQGADRRVQHAARRRRPRRGAVPLPSDGHDPGRGQEEQQAVAVEDDGLGAEDRGEVHGQEEEPAGPSPLPPEGVQPEGLQEQVRVEGRAEEREGADDLPRLGRDARLHPQGHERHDHRAEEGVHPRERLPEEVAGLLLEQRPEPAAAPPEPDRARPPRRRPSPEPPAPRACASAIR